ncbi:SusC/RagA family TonB-linked outer membrane protein [Robertkochia solimangrovi]|uniref:SusC/RagA family TonB-linked outer membrane protein n=1 Tax=Robertkochia solimangrovi TaxID=2213046 RepID=UPI0013A533FE|nr:SusC/RagA family TonB-linked outer membrane protein [Robertkochia solimangrovi]
MKLFFMFLLCAMFGLQANEGYAQKTRLTLDFTNTEISKIIDEIELTTEFKFFYKSDEIDLERRINLNVQKEKIQTILERMFWNTDITYNVHESQIILKRNNTESKKNHLESINQNFKKVSGKITDSEGIPLTGVTIMTMDGIYGVTSDFEGIFEMNVPVDTKEIIVNYIGFKTQKIDLTNIQDLRNLNISLIEDINELDEVVVTGYQTLAKERAVGSFSQVNEEQIQMRPATGNIIERIEGTVAGLNIDSEGAVTIRGGSSINLSNQPLIVVDGFPIADNSLQAINPEDVKSINILKDASAASIWGVRASNGVIVITTKKGNKDQKLTIRASAFTSITEKIDYSDIGLLSTSDQIDMELEILEKNWYNESTFRTYLTNSNSFSLVNEAMVYKLGMAPNGDVWTQSQFDDYINSLRTRSAEEDWQKYLLRNATNATYNISLSTGSEKNTTYASLVYNLNKEAAIGNADNRIIFNINDTYHFSDKLEFNAALIATLTNATYNGTDYRAILAEDAYNSLVDEYGNTIQYSPYYHRWATQERSDITGISQYYNELDQIRANDNSSQGVNIRSRFGLKATLIDGLDFRSNFQYEKGFSETDEFQSMDHYDQRDRIGKLYVDGVYQLPLGTRYLYRRNTFDAWYFRNTLNFDKTFGKHAITLFAGTDITRRTSEGIKDRKYGYDKQTRIHVPVDEAALQGREYRDWRGFRYYEGNAFTNANSDVREMSWYGNAAYEFNKKYSLNGSFRIDQKNLFGSDPKYRYKPLWSAGVAWNLNNEDFFNVSWVNRLRFRATIGINGNASESSSPYAQAAPYLYAYGRSYSYLDLTSPPNPQLRWESTRVTNYGLDFNLFNNRVGGSIEYYIKNSTDLLGNRALDPTNGFNSAEVNYASMTNKGIEVTLNADIVRSKDFIWNVNANISYNKNEVTDLEIGEQSVRDIIRYGKFEVGEPLYNVWSYNYAGLDNAGNVLLHNNDGTTKSWQDGATEEELINQGVLIAPWYGGLTNTFRFKGFDLTANLVYKFGNVFNHNYGIGYDTRNTHMFDVWKDRWMQPGDEATTRIPKLAYNGVNPYNGETERSNYSSSADHFWQYSQDNILPGGFIRVRDIILGYTLPKTVTDLTFFSDLRLTFQARNPFIWTENDRGLDPDAMLYSPVGGVDLTNANYYTNLRSFTFGVRATF